MGEFPTPEMVRIPSHISGVVRLMGYPSQCNNLADMNRIFRMQVLALLVVIGLFSTYAFASSQADQPVGGEGANAISGWDISGVHYLPANDPSKLAGVEFDLNSPADVVKVSLNSSNSMFFDCVHTAGYHWVCSIDPSMKVSEANELRVIATGG